MDSFIVDIILLKMNYFTVFEKFENIRYNRLLATKPNIILIYYCETFKYIPIIVLDNS